MRHPVTAFLPDGTSYQISRAEADLLVRSGATVQARTARHLVKEIKLVPRIVVRGMSARFGEYLAARYAEKDGIARVIVAHIRNQREAPSYEHAEL